MKKLRIVTRAEVLPPAQFPVNAGRLRDRSPAELAALLGITWHDTGVGGNLYNPDPWERIRGIWRYHVQTLGYGDIAYHGAFGDHAGEPLLFLLREPQFVGAHAGSDQNIANRFTNGVCFLEDRDGMTRESAVAMKGAVDLFRLAYGRNPAGFDHNFWRNYGGKPTGCSGPVRPLLALLGGHL